MLDCMALAPSYGILETNLVKAISSVPPAWPWARLRNLSTEGTISWSRSLSKLTKKRSCLMIGFADIVWLFFWLFFGCFWEKG